MSDLSDLIAMREKLDSCIRWYESHLIAVDKNRIAGCLDFAKFDERKLKEMAAKLVLQSKGATPQ